MLNNFKKPVSLFVLLMMVLTFVIPLNVLAADGSQTGIKTFDFIEITDFHGTLEDSKGLPVGAVLAKNIKSIRDTNPDRTLIIGGGDLYQGSPISNILKGVPVQEVMNNIGMEVTALGNHEFDWSIHTLKNITMKNAKYSIICANVYDKTTNERAFDPYKIIEKDGVKIAVIGAITAETPSKVLAANVANFTFTDPAGEINTAAKEIRDGKKADIVLAVVHEGGAINAQGGMSGALFDIAKSLSGVDVLFGGHTHTAVNTKVNNMPVVIANYNGKGYIDVKMTLDASGSKSFSSEYVALDNDKPNGYKAKEPALDTDIKAIVDAAKEQVGPLFSENLGTAEQDLARIQDAIPYGESYLGNWICDVIKSKSGADVALQNNGGIRMDIPKGNINVGTMYYIMPFDNTICTLEMKKSELKALLEQAFNDADETNKISKGLGIQLSGIKVIYDTSKPSSNRIVDITREDDSAIGDSDVLKVATNDFLATGGDGFTEFKKYTYTDTHILVRDAMVENVKANQGIKTSLNKRINNISQIISIVGTSDLHGNIYPMDYFTGKAADQGLAKVSTYVKNIRFSNSNVVLVDAGDTIQGTPLASYYDLMDTKSEYPMMKVMGAMKYDTWTLGNHEFNYGRATLERIMKDASKEGITVLSANTYSSDGTNYVKPYFIKSFIINGKEVKVGILGLTTKTIPSWENESNYKGLQFNDLVDEAKKWVPMVKAEGADVIVATIHSGEEKASDIIPENQVKAVATGVSGIDAIICGHTHEAINQDVFKNPEGKNVLVTEPKKWGTYVSEVDINVNSVGNITGIGTKIVPMDSSIAADTEITALAQPYQDATLQYINTVIGQSTGEYSGKGQTTKPTALMDLINVVQMKAANTQLSIAAPLSESAYIPQGDIKIKDIMSVYVYENFLYGIKMTGADLKKWMEFSVRYYKQTADASEPAVKDTVLNIPDYNLDILYGATYNIDLTQPAGRRIKNLRYHGKPILDSDVFTVAVNNYRFNGGGGFMAAAGLKPGDTGIVTYDSAKTMGDDGQVRNLMTQYVQDNKVINPSVANNWSFSSTPAARETAAQSSPVKEIVYVVLPGDCLSVIGKKFKVPYMDIARRNHIQNVDLIFAGQTLIIPTK